MRPSLYSIFFFFNDTATTEIYTLSLHDALPILRDRDDQRVGLLRDALGGAVPRARLQREDRRVGHELDVGPADLRRVGVARDRKSTRLNSSHANISYAVFCLKKKKLL